MHAPVDKPMGPWHLNAEHRIHRHIKPHSEEMWHTPELHHSPAIQEQPALPQSMLSLSAGAPCTLLTMLCGQHVCSYVPDTGEQPHQEPQGDSEEGSAAAGSSAGRVCAGVFVVEATPDTEVDVDVDPGRQVPQGDSEEYRIQNTLSCQAFAQSYSLMPSRKCAPVSSGAFAGPTITQAL